ncbi:MAG TPA: MFS transporter [Actinomycetota bacterium]|jgi:EmrB/QacA subfamily drug resistance transporter
MFEDNRREKLLTLGTMCFALFMAMLDNTVVNVALPKIQAHLGSGVSGLQWVVDAYTLLFASLLLTGGTLGDLYGRKRMFQAGLLIFSLGSLLCGLAPSIGFLIASRALQGIGAAALIPSTLSIITVTFPDPRERAQAIGMWAGVSGLALALGPVVGGLLVDSLGWQSVFFLNVPIGILAFFVAARFVSESKNPEGRTIDLAGQILGITWLAALVYALIEGNARGWRSPIILTMFAIAAVGLVAFLFVERRSKSPMLRLDFFRVPTFTAGVTVAALVSFGMFGMLFFLSLFMQNVQDYSALGAGLRFLPATVAIIITAPLAGRLAGRIGSRWPMTIGMAMNGAAMLMYLSVHAGTPYSSWWWIQVIQGVGMGLTMAPMTAAVMGAVPPARAGMASATTNTSREVGGTFGIALLGAILTSRFKSVLASALAAQGVPAALRERIAFAVSHGQTGGAGALPAGVDAGALKSVFANAFVDGMHLAMVVAAAALLFGSLVAFTFVRPARTQGVPAIVQPEAVPA